MKSIQRIVAVCAAGLVSSACAEANWNWNFPDSLALANRENRPLILIWGNTGCDYCSYLADEIKGATFGEWYATEGANFVLCHVTGMDGEDLPANIGAKEFAATANGTKPGLTSYPFVCFYYPIEHGVAFCADNAVGRSGRMGGPVTSGELSAQLISAAEKFMANLKLPETGIGFRMGNTLNDRLEAVAGRAGWVDVPLLRTNLLSTATTCALEIEYKTGVAVSNLTWAAGDVEKFVRFTIPSDMTAGETLEVRLRNALDEIVATRAITFISAAEFEENGPKNPLFLGERTADDLQWGEWTMDLAVATQRVIRASGAGTLILVGGALWCPDCYSTDKYLIDTPAFRAWSKNRNIACVAIDVVNPNDVKANTSLLTWDPTRTSDRYVTCNKGEPPNENLRFQSGGGYLSRHQVSPDRAAEVAARNLNLLMNSTKAGGLCRPEDVDVSNPHTGPFKTGIPCLIALRPDGTVAGRIYQFNNTSASSAVDQEAHLARLDELFDQVAVQGEEDNDHEFTTHDEIAATEVKEASISAVDGQDVYRIADSAGMRMTYELTGEADADVTLEICDDSGEATRSLAMQSGSLSKGLCASARLPSDRCSVRISYPKNKDGYATVPYFDFKKTGSTVCPYRLEASGEMSGGEIGFAKTAIAASEGEGLLKIPLVRRLGSGGSVSVQVSLDRTPPVQAALAAGRIVWDDVRVPWEDNAEGRREVTLTIVDDEEKLEDLDLVFRISDLQAEKDATIDPNLSVLTVRIADNDGTAIALHRNVSMCEKSPVDGWQPGDEAVLTKVSGSMPTGLRIDCEDGFARVSGVPARTGDYAVSYRVSLYRQGEWIGDQTFAWEFSVGKIDFSALIPGLSEARTFANLPVTQDACDACGDSRRRLSGLLTLTIPPNGKVSAKLVGLAEVITYSAGGWDSFEDEGRLTVRLTPFEGKGPILDVSVFGDRLSIVAEGIDCNLPLEGWTAKADASPWGGQYTVQMPQENMTDTAVNGMRMTGDAYLAMRMVTDVAKANGYMIYAGVLPNGRGFSGSSVLIAGDGGTVTMPFFGYCPNPRESFGVSGSVDICGNPKEVLWAVTATENVVPHWETRDAYAHAGDFIVYGGYYDSSAVLDNFWSDYEGVTDRFALRGAAGEMDDIPLRMTDAGPVLARDEDATLTFSPVTGVVSGHIGLSETENIPYRGIVLPGWQACPDCKPGQKFVERPWASGPAAYYDWSEWPAGRAIRDGFGIVLDCGM